MWVAYSVNIESIMTAVMRFKCNRQKHFLTTPNSELKHLTEIKKTRYTFFLNHTDVKMALNKSSLITTIIATTIIKISSCMNERAVSNCSSGQVLIF
jgi:hypothetical protein